MVVDPTKPAACLYCHKMVIPEEWPGGPKDVLSVARAIRGFRRHEENINQEHYEAAECWEQLAATVLDYWYAKPRGLTSTMDHADLEWDLSLELAEKAGVHKFPLPVNACIGLAYIMFARIETYVIDHPLAPLDGTKQEAETP